MSMLSIAVPSTAAKHHGAMARGHNVRGRGRQAMADNLAAQGLPRQASSARLQRGWADRHGVRFRIGNGQGLYLSGDGQGTTDKSALAWFGTSEQADVALALFPLAAGMRPLRVIDKLLPERVSLRTIYGVS